jgi:pseudouridine kinase
MTHAPDILCIGSVLWDVIGRAPSVMRVGSDVPGRITRLPGGGDEHRDDAAPFRDDALPCSPPSAATRRARNFWPPADRMGLVADHVYVSEDLPTDRYMAIEGRTA